MTIFTKIYFDRIKIVAFDLDGVIINSLNNMKYAWAMTCRKNNIKIPFKKYKKKIGLPFEKILNELGIKSKKTIIKKDYVFFSSKKINLIKIYKDAKKIVNYIRRKYIVGFITSKDKQRSLKILKKNKIRYDFLICPEDVKKGKPNPASAQKIKKNYKVKGSSIIYIGDTKHDYLFAKNSKIKFIFAKWGYGKVTNKNIFKLNSIKQIKKYI